MPSRIAGRAREGAAPPPKKVSQPSPAKRSPVRDPIAAAIVKARMRAGLTQRELAERLHTDQGNIARLERRPTRALMRALKRIADATRHELVINVRRASMTR